MRLGQEFGGYAEQVEQSREASGGAAKAMYELPLGGTAVGTGLNACPEFAPARDCAKSRSEPGCRFARPRITSKRRRPRMRLVHSERRAQNLRRGAHQNRERYPLAGHPGRAADLGELKLPATQPGSSIMPGKVNPVIAREPSDGLRAGDRL